MGLLFKNNAETTLSSGINNSVTTVPVASAAVFPTPDANNVFFATIDDGSNIEVVKVTGISSNDLTVVRAQDNTSAAAFGSGAKIELRLTAKILEMGTSSLTDLDGDTAIFVEQLDDEDQIRMDTGGNQRVLINSNGLEISSGNISNASGDLTLDVAGDITFDAGGGDILLKDDGTLVGTIGGFSGNNVTIKSEVSDGDVIFQGNDGGSGITALTLDMSEQGNATFNKNVIFGDNGKALFGAGTDLAIFSDGTDGKVETNGDLRLDIDGQHIHFFDGGVHKAEIALDSAGFVLQTIPSNEDIFFSGNDDGTGITAVRIDMSDAGHIICKGNITAFGNVSDIRLKENIEVIPDALDKVKQLKGITFNYKKDGKVSTGLIAQDLEKVLPEAVYTSKQVESEEEHLAIRYGNTVGLLVEAIKEQQEQIEALTAKVKELEAK